MATTTSTRENEMTTTQYEAQTYCNVYCTSSVPLRFDVYRRTDRGEVRIGRDLTGPQASALTKIASANSKEV